MNWTFKLIQWIVHEVVYFDSNETMQTETGLNDKRIKKNRNAFVEEGGINIICQSDSSNVMACFMLFHNQ